MVDAPKAIVASHVLQGDGTPRILTTEERAAADAQVHNVVTTEWPEMLETIRRTCQEDGIDEFAGVLLVADVRGKIGAWLLNAFTGGRVTVGAFTAAASRAHRAAPLLAHYLSQEQADEHLPRLVPRALEAVGPRRADAVRVVIINKTDQVAIAYRQIDPTESDHA